MRIGGIIAIVYLVIGVLVAANRNYLGDINSVGALIDLLLAIVLWPLILLGVDINLAGDGGKGGGKGKGGKGGGGKNGAVLVPALLYLRAALENGMARRTD
jgi:hypothetical protein